MKGVPSKTELITIMKRHRKMKTRDWCEYDALDWPCDTSIVIAKMADLESKLAERGCPHQEGP